MIRCCRCGTIHKDQLLYRLTDRQENRFLNYAPSYIAHEAFAAYKARNFTAVKLVTKASRWRKLGMRGRKKKGRGVPNPRIASFAGNSERQIFARCTVRPPLSRRRLNVSSSLDPNRTLRSPSPVH
ncbi:hypothetical protein EVAR_19902_1 [Eumeta japonica]|uniref:Uncharacterized protein n=1 Tax=Eumeta variegata TaxID=151549 RepID=A0A4C1XMT5_EUMVA|nr:hypothetical protein EVAR_19902_1 [Eumeta japonica]